MTVRLSILRAGPLVSVQDAGRPGLMRFGVPASGPMDRVALAAANRALGNPPGAACIEVSLAGLTLECAEGTTGFAVAGGGFSVIHAGRQGPSWQTGTLREGDRLEIRPGRWGSWCYLAFPGGIEAPEWLGSRSTHSLSGLGGGALRADGIITLADPRAHQRPHEGRDGPFPCPVFARPRRIAHLVPGPQNRYFTPAAIEALLSSDWTLTTAADRMGVRLSGPAIAPAAPLDMPSEPIARGSIQVAGDGVATVLMADHQTTGGYPKIATILDCDLDGFAQLRPRERVAFRALTPEDAIARARTHAAAVARYLDGLSR